MITTGDVERRCQERVQMGKDTAEEKVRIAQQRFNEQVDMAERRSHEAGRSQSGAWKVGLRLVAATRKAKACIRAQDWRCAVLLLERPLDATDAWTAVRGVRWGQRGAFVAWGLPPQLRVGAAPFRSQLVVRGAHIAAAARWRRWQAALQLLHVAEDEGLPQDAIGFSAAMHGCVKAHRWTMALELLAAMEMKRLGLPQVTVNTAITSACAKGHQWQQALALLEDGIRASVRPSRLTMVVALSATSDGSWWEGALHWLQLSRTLGRDPKTETSCFNAALRASAAALDHRRQEGCSELHHIHGGLRAKAHGVDVSMMELKRRLRRVPFASAEQLAPALARVMRRALETSLEDLCSIWEVCEERCSADLEPIGPEWARALGVMKS
eukprot:g13191.t1